MMPVWLLPVIAADLAITGVVVWFVFRRKGAGSNSRRIVGADFKALTAFTTAIHPQVGDYVRANWSGMPEQLPAVLRVLLDDLEREARQRGLHVDRPMLKLLLARSLAQHGIGNGTDVRHALDEVA
jgi:hypothetical protein